jgi:hypothetical protein
MFAMEDRVSVICCPLPRMPRFCPLTPPHDENAVERHVECVLEHDDFAGAIRSRLELHPIELPMRRTLAVDHRSVVAGREDRK